MTSAASEFLRNAAIKSADLAHRDTIRRNISTYDTAVTHGKALFADWEEARRRCAEIKWEAINHLDRYLLEFEKNVKARGGRVFWATDAHEARKYITDLAIARGVKLVVKAKSMATEEIHLAEALEKCSIRAVETDLGEFIVQLRHEPPYHIVTPAMHLSRGEIARTFREKLECVTTDDPEELVLVARRALRKAFFSAEMGVTGANFLVADAGMIALTTNEGNARLCTCVPRIHVALVGIEKVIPRLADLAVMWPTLATAGTGQHLTTYNSLIGGPRQPGETDGPEEFHVVLLDNGRTKLLADAEQRDVLHCIRCGACLNACPVYRTIGGHAYATTYPGPIGSVLTPHLRGFGKWQHLSFASSLCGNCTSVCPVGIDLHHHLLQNRRNAVEKTGKGLLERLSFLSWRRVMMSGTTFRIAGAVTRKITRLVRKLGLSGTFVDPMRRWTQYRIAPDVPRESFRELWRKRHGQQ